MVLIDKFENKYTMQKYVRQLIYDIERRLGAIPPNIRYRDLNTCETIEDALRKATFKPLSQWIQLSNELFPPSNQLSEHETELILAALKRLLCAHGFIVNFPEQAPLNLKYKALINHLYERTPFLENHLWQLPLCGYEAKKCPFGTFHCQCKDWEDILFGISEEAEATSCDQDNGIIFINEIK